MIPTVVATVAFVSVAHAVISTGSMCQMSADDCEDNSVCAMGTDGVETCRTYPTESYCVYAASTPSFSNCDADGNLPYCVAFSDAAYGDGMCSAAAAEGVGCRRTVAASQSDFGKNLQGNCATGLECVNNKCTNVADRVAAQAGEPCDHNTLDGPFCDGFVDQDYKGLSCVANVCHVDAADVPCEEQSDCPADLVCKTFFTKTFSMSHFCVTVVEKNAECKWSDAKSEAKYCHEDQICLWVDSSTKAMPSERSRAGSRRGLRGLAMSMEPMYMCFDDTCFGMCGPLTVCVNGPNGGRGHCTPKYEDYCPPRSQHACCEPAKHLSPECSMDTVSECVCKMDDVCCEKSGIGWDHQCVSEAIDLCGLQC